MLRSLGAVLAAAAIGCGAPLFGGDDARDVGTGVNVGGGADDAPDASAGVDADPRDPMPGDGVDDGDANGGGGSGGPAGTVGGLVFEVTDAGVTPVAGAQVWIWVWSGGGGRQYGPVTTDGAGQYSQSGLPAGGVAMVYVVKSGYRQPCGAYQPYGGGSGGQRNVRLYTDAALAAPGAAPPAEGSPAATGVVYETVDGARVPIAGAVVFLEALGGLGLVAGTYVTNARGEYFICEIPDHAALGITGGQSVVLLQAWHADFAYSSSNDVAAAPIDQDLSFELRRN